MTFYLTPYNRRMMRHMMNRMMEGGMTGAYSEVAFPIDVKVEDEAYVISALLPSITPENLEIQVVNETVTLKGEFHNDRVEGERYLIQERPDGRFERIIQLPERLDSSKAEAHMENGVLSLRIPKADEVRPKTIKINVN